MQQILTTVLIITAFTGILALLLTLADRTIGDYGEKFLTINNEEPIKIDAGDSLLSTLLSQKIFIPSACGGKGTCGYCKVKVLEGGGPILATELPWLTEEEQADNVRLSCQCKVKEDMKIEIPEELFSVKEFDARVESIVDVTSKIKKLKLVFEDGEKIDFKAGQFIQFRAPLYEGNDEEVFRAYSIASSPENKDYIELLVGYVPGGIATTYIHQHLKEGDIVNLNGPHGDFFYQDNREKEMVMVGAGTGMAPILSILRFMRDNEIDRKIKFYFGARTPEDLFLLDEINGFYENFSDYKFIPTLSRVTEEHNWTGETGRVNDALMKHMESPDSKEAYLCGSPPMIDSVTGALHEKGLEDEYIFYDKFE